MAQKCLSVFRLRRYNRGIAIQKPTVLIVGNDEIVTSDLRLIVERMGGSVVGTADSGCDAIRLGRQLRPAVALFDVRLRGEMSGIDAANQLRRGQRLAIVYVTSQGDIAAVNLDSGVGLVRKPFDAGQLEAAIRSALNSLPASAGAGPD